MLTYMTPNFKKKNSQSSGQGMEVERIQVYMLNNKVLCYRAKHPITRNSELPQQVANSVHEESFTEMKCELGLEEF